MEYLDSRMENFYCKRMCDLPFHLSVAHILVALLPQTTKKWKEIKLFGIWPRMC